MREPIEDLIQRVLDGSATPEERNRLDTLIAADPALRRRHEELAHVFTVLGSARMAAPPEDLRGSVMQAIADLPTSASRRAQPGSHRIPRGARWFRFALPVTAVIAAAVLVWAVRSPSPASRAGISGTMAGQARSVAVRLGDGAAAVVVEGRAAETGFELELRAGMAAGVAVLSTGEEHATLTRSPRASIGDSQQLSIEFEPGSRILAYGRGTGPEVPLRIAVRFADGRQAFATLGIPVRRARGPGG